MSVVFRRSVEFNPELIGYVVEIDELARAGEGPNRCNGEEHRVLTSLTVLVHVFVLVGDDPIEVVVKRLSQIDDRPDILNLRQPVRIDVTGS